MMKKLLFMFITFVLSFSLSGCNTNNEIVYEDFIYCGSTDMMGKYCLSIKGLSEQGKSKEIVVIPTIIKNKLVKSLGYETGLSINGKIESDIIEKLYVHNQIERHINPEFFGGDISFVYLGYSYEKLSYMMFDINCKVFVSKNDFLQAFDEEFYLRYNEGLLNNEYEYTKIKFANVIYYYNYDNKLFFVDDCDGTTVNVIPPTPYRKGYEFAGWYKEPECINKWDFENDIVPAKEYEENGEYILKETKLYAKWEK